MRTALWRATRVKVYIFLVAVGFVLATAAGIQSLGSDDQRGGDQPTASHAPTPGSPEQLLEANGCWSGPAPADMEGRLPGHVVVTRADGRTVVGGPRLVEQALNQVFGGEDNGLTVHGFCK